jgi:hypothetical protein
MYERRPWDYVILYYLSILYQTMKGLLEISMDGDYF